MEVCVWRADLTTFPAGAVVNGANVRLKHFGGVALALSKAGGPDIQNESNKYIAKFGHLKTGEAIFTNAGNLPCKKIIHAVGPRLPPKPTSAMVSAAVKKLRRAQSSRRSQIPFCCDSSCEFWHF